MDDMLSKDTIDQIQKRNEIVEKLITEKSDFIGSYRSLCFYGEENWETVFSIIQRVYLPDIASDEYPIVAYAVNYPQCITGSGFSQLLFTEYFGKSGFLFTTKNLYFLRSSHKLKMELEKIVQITVKKGLFGNKYIIAMKNGTKYELGADIDYSIMKSLGGVMSKILFTILAKTE